MNGAKHRALLGRQGGGVGLAYEQRRIRDASESSAIVDATHGWLCHNGMGDGRPGRSGHRRLSIRLLPISIKYAKGKGAFDGSVMGLKSLLSLPRVRKAEWTGTGTAHSPRIELCAEARQGLVALVEVFAGTSDSSGLDGSGNTGNQQPLLPSRHVT